MNNVVLNKPASATQYVKPFSPQRAVDGKGGPVYRWLGNVPCALTVNLGGSKWIDTWRVYHMGSIGWKGSNYNNKNYMLEGSSDGINWHKIDEVTNNTSPATDNKFTAQEVQHVRLVMISGLIINPKLASVAEFEVYEAQPTSSQLSSLLMSTGVLSPNFSSTVFSYTAEVDASVSEITLKPTSIDGGIIKINNILVDSGVASTAIALAIGENIINIEVTSKIGNVKSAYVVKVTRVPNLYLSSLGLAYTGRGYSETDSVDMNHTTLNYTDNTSVKAKSVKITPVAEDPSVNITVNDESVVSGGTTSSISLPNESNTITLVASMSGSSTTKTYMLNIERK